MYQSYDPNTGEILYTTYISPADAKAAVEQFGDHLCEGDGDGLTHYVNIHASPPRVVQRPAQATQQNKTEVTANGTDLLVLSGLPVPCVVNIGAEQYNVPDGILEWATLMPGARQITVQVFPYLDWTSEVTAVESDAHSNE